MLQGIRRLSVYPAFDAYYYSFYLQGISEFAGRSDIQFSSRPFPSLPSGYLAFIANVGPRELRVAVDAYDGAVLTKHNHALLEWCDVYGKVNLSLPLVPKEYARKCLPIGPSFDVRLWGVTESLWLAASNYRLAVDYSFMRLGINSSREHLANYRRQYKYSLPMTCFVPGVSDKKYVFFAATVWPATQAQGTNEHRKSFIACCKSLNGLASFEGGFSPPKSQDWPSEYDEHTAPKRYTMAEWLAKTKSSALAFNTPAVWSCHSFRLAQYLALGKAIISTPLSRELPSPLIDRYHVHYVDGSVAAIGAAIELILADDDYRKHLERNAAEYFRAVLSPRRVIERLLSAGS